MTLIGYFNSIRELGGTRRLVEDDIREYIYRKGPINPELLVRLKKYKEKKQNELDSQPF